MRKCQLINKDAESSVIKMGEYYKYKNVTDQKDYNGNSIFLAFPYHIYDINGHLVDVVSELGFLRDFIDIQKDREEKLKKINENANR